MNSVFQLSHGDRVKYLQDVMNSVGACYICLWTFSPNHNFMYCEDGYYLEESASSSSVGESIAQRLFNEYKQIPIIAENDLVPGLAFKNRNPYLKLQELDLQRLATVESQRQFYQTALFLGSEKGEIELGMSNIPQNLEIKMQNMIYPRTEKIPIPNRDQQNKLQSASSLSQSIDSSDQYSILYTLPITNTCNNTNTNTTNNTINPHLNHPLLQQIPFPTPESTDAALTKAYLAILSSPYSVSKKENQKESAFRKYCGSINIFRNDLRRPTLFKRSVAFYRSLHFRRLQEVSIQGPSRPTTTQSLHHMISERKRREKINESFQALRSLLPQGTKKDKASVLRSTKEHINTLRAQLTEISQRNQLLEAQVISKRPTFSDPSPSNITDHVINTTIDDQRLAVKITPVSESSSSGDHTRMINLTITLRRSGIPVADFVIKILEFIKKVNQVNIISMEAETTHHSETTPGVLDQIPTNHRVTFRLKIEGNEWDEFGFTEAIQRLISD
ncbi:putative transcription factor bHLH041 isoform X2 [Amaranthus tricolor]|uniref:putative transcription factor bHLH041 isoform X2 n=1 Tax=Amaranthus tricolor TaxID=29722 RepID=UPI00258A29F5|nr:putative transcription factor bHLH041 isoform X2 [Amaranthus tricolor]